MVATQNFFGFEFPLAFAWTYGFHSHEREHEFSFWDGRVSPALSTHLHDEIQLTFVFSGMRRFLVGARPLEVHSGEIAVIPANAPHCSLGVPQASTLSFDLFIKPDPTSKLSQIGRGVLKMSRYLQENPALTADELESEIGALVESQTGDRPVSELGECFIDFLVNSDQKISVIAETAGLSREGFIRAFRCEVGVTPHAYRIAHRTKEARAQLRTGESLAIAAVDAGFADQSHLGRVFKRSFGTTPAVYRSVWQA